MQFQLYAFITAAAFLYGSTAVASGTLFFSEYLEGTSDNKALEIYNGTAAAVDLTDYRIQIYFNGQTTPRLTLDLAGSIAPGATFVLANANADPAVRALADQTAGGNWFNGDDTVVLRKDGAIIDAIGQLGHDPGSGWGTPPVSTRDRILRRKATVRSGDNNADDAFAPAAQWDGFPSDAIAGLGTHRTGTSDSFTIGDCGAPAEPIHAIQTAAATSPRQGERVAIEGVVVGDFQGGQALNGFFVQEEDDQQDNDPATSEGLFVFDNGVDVDVQPGDVVRVAGVIAEFPESKPASLTRLADISAIIVCGRNQSVTPTPLELPFADRDLPERFEGMLITLAQTLTVTDVHDLARYGEIVLSNGRLSIPTHLAKPGEPARIVAADNERNRLLIDDGRNGSYREPIRYPAPGLTAANTLRAGDSVTAVLGVLAQGFGQYRLHPVTPPIFTAANPRPLASALPDNGALRVAAFNVLNYFNGDGHNGAFPTPRGAETRFEFSRQRIKTVAAILALQADVVGLVELENDGFGPHSAIRDLVAGLNEAAPAGMSYALIDPAVARIGTDAITVGLIYRLDKVTPRGTAAILDSRVDAGFNDEKNRPALAQTFTEQASGEIFTVVVNHFKSKGSDCDELGDPDRGDGQGNCNNTRTAAAQALVEWLATDPTGSDDTDVLIIGDLNAYAQEDPIVAIEASGYVDLLERFHGTAAYSYVFGGQAGYLDHALASASLARQVTAVAEWHINADEPRALAYFEQFRDRDQRRPKSDSQLENLYAADPYRSSDHDPLIVSLRLNGDSSDTPSADDETTDDSGDTPTDDDVTGGGERDDYYVSARGKTGQALKAALHDIIREHNVLSYGEIWTLLMEADEDPENPHHVILFYSGRSQPKRWNSGEDNSNQDYWNREHVWARRHGLGPRGRPGRFTDAHNLRPTDASINQTRGNLGFDDGGQPHNEAPDTFSDNDSWEPRDAIKGDVARTTFYMAVRYEQESGRADLELVDRSSGGGDSGTFGKLCTLMQWHRADPVDDAERQRHEIIAARQGNRNPFIDHPEWAVEIWGGSCGGDF